MLKYWLGAAVGVSLVVVAPRAAEACGGCFNPPENPTVVTDHRMIFTIAKDQSTLYDQIRYTGSPASFGWVLPTKGEVGVGISADSVFATLDTFTQTQIVGPPRNCPSPSCNSGFSLASDDRAASGAAPPQDVNVIKREVVGPYETVQLQSTSPNALKEWLAKNGFTIPPDVVPLIDAYVAESFNFLALKLVPGKGIQDMRPVRVTTKGANVILPLRMVAAGTGATVGISLWVVSEGRYEPQNFGNFVIKTEELAWDWTQNKSNYVDVRAQKTAAGQGRVWEIESSLDLQRNQLDSVLRSRQSDYAPEQDGQGTVTKPADIVRTEDVDTLLFGLANVRVTRMRADLAHAALNTDLVMTASQDQAVLSNVHRVTRELNEPICPVFAGCEQVGQAPRSQALKGNGGETFSCEAPRKATTHGRSPWIVAGLAAVGLVEIVRRRRRSKR